MFVFLSGFAFILMPTIPKNVEFQYECNYNIKTKDDAQDQHYCVHGNAYFVAVSIPECVQCLDLKRGSLL